MGHEPGFPCLFEEPNHEGRCSTPVSGVDLSKTRLFEVSDALGVYYYRTNSTAGLGSQVERLASSHEWIPSVSFDTEGAFLRSIEGSDWRELAGEELAAFVRVGDSGDAA